MSAMKAIMTSGLAGLAATVPMTIAMEMLFRELPKEEQYPLPPRTITMNLAADAGVKGSLDEKDREVVTIAGHFGYGAAVGAFYGVIGDKLPLENPVLK